MNRAIDRISFSAVIFDMDGLVLDTEKTYNLAWEKALADMGVQLASDFFITMSGLQYQDVEQRLLGLYGDDFDLNHFSELSGTYWHYIVNEQGIPVKKGFHNLLKQLYAKDLPFCLATNSHTNNALECLKLAGLDNVFSTIISRDQVKQGKPAPDVFILAAKTLKQPISQCLVLEDSDTGIQASVSAGGISVYIPSIIPCKQATVDLADYFYNNLDELAQIIQ